MAVLPVFRYCCADYLARDMYLTVNLPWHTQKSSGLVQLLTILLVSAGSSISVMPPRTTSPMPGQAHHHPPQNHSLLLICKMHECFLKAELVYFCLQSHLILSIFKISSLLILTSSLVSLAEFIR